MDIIKKINDIAINVFQDNNSKFATFMDTSETNIRNYRSKTTPKVDFIVSLCNKLEISFEWMFNDIGEMERGKLDPVTSVTKEFVLRSDSRKEIQRIPLYEMFGDDSLINLFERQLNIIDYITIPNLPASDGALYITGDSMYPILRSGDVAIIKRVNNLSEGIYFGEMHIISCILDGNLTTLVKFVQRSDKGYGFIKLVSHNVHYAPREVSLKKVKAMALIKASIRINSMN